MDLVYDEEKENLKIRIQELEKKLKEKEIELVENTNFYNGLSEFMSDAIFFNDEETILYTNKSGIKLLGAKCKSEVLGKRVVDFLCLEDREEIILKLHNHVREGIEEIQSERKLLKLDGTIIDVKLKVTYIPFKGKSIGVAVIKDVTERKNVEKALREREEIYRKLTELLPMGVYIHSYGFMELANKTCVKLLGVESEKELIGKNVFEFIHSEYAHSSRDRLNAIVDSDGNAMPPFYNKLIRKDGSTLDVETWSITFYDNNRLKILSVFRDITDLLKVEELKKRAEDQKRQLQEEREFNELKTEFFSNLSHELKTPLNVILGSRQLISLYLENENLFQRNRDKIDKHLIMLKQNCNRLLRLINNLIDITKIDSGFFNLNMSTYNIINIIEEITLSVAEYVEEKGIKLLFDTDVEEKMTLCDPDKIERIMLNLLSNSVKFTEPGGEIIVMIYDKGDTIIVSVKDTGIGIPEDKLDIIFDRFRQVDGSLTRKRDGSGIGLSLVKSLVEMHEGTIKVESVYGCGSEFIIEFPIREALDCNLERKRIAAIEDEKVERIQVEFSDIYSL